MHKSSFRCTIPFLRTLIGALALLMLVCVWASPTKAWAADAVASAKDNGTTIYYYNTNDAIKAGYSGKTIVMEKDWIFSDTLDIEDSKTITIDMNGHRIANNDKETVIHLDDDSNLILTSSTSLEFSYTGYNVNDGNKGNTTITTGGLITGGIANTEAGGITMDSDSKLTLDNVAIAGNFGGDAGGIYMYSNCQITMKNKASIEHNEGSAGGIWIENADAKISMDNSSISYNYSRSEGGAIYSNADGTRISMENDSTMSYNQAVSGGALFFNYSFFTLESKDGKATISHNYARGDVNGLGGGAIWVEEKKWAQNEGYIKNITISDNSTEGAGGAIYTNQRWTNIVDCTITGNTSKYNGGGIYVENNDCHIDGCTIRNNSCAEGREGGGVFVRCTVDINLSGVCVIKDNLVGQSQSSDLCLEDSVACQAYITGGVKKGSSVGVTIDKIGDCRIGKDITTYAYGTYFITANNFYVSHGADAGGDLWQRCLTTQYLAQVNGEGSTRYCWNTPVNALGLTSDKELAFWYWDDYTTTGLNPVSDYINDNTKYWPVLRYNMPQNDTDVVAVYANRIKECSLYVKDPVANEALPTSAHFRRNDTGLGANGVIYNIPITWYEVASDGTRSVATGNAKPGTTYVASISVAERQNVGLFFYEDISADNIIIRSGTNYNTRTKVVSASIEEYTGTLTCETASFTTEGEAPVEDKTGTITVNMENAGLAGGRSTQGLSALEASIQESSSLGSFKVSYTKGSDEVTITAPSVDNMYFCNWENVKEGWVSDDLEGSVVIPAAELTDDLTITATYNPVITEIDIDMDAPVAGKDLDTSATSFKITASDGTTFDFADAYATKSLAVSWAPSSDDTKADYSTAYTALIEVVSGEGYENLDKYLSANAVVKVGDTQVKSAAFTTVDDKLCLCVGFDETDKVKLSDFTRPDDVELSFEEACGYAADQTAHPDTLCWPLPKSVTVTLENGEQAVEIIEWDIPSGFDANAQSAQEITVKGKVLLSNYIDANGSSLDVTTTIKIAAPQGTEPNNDNPDVINDGGTDEGSAGANADANLAKTGDTTPVFALIAAVVVAGIVLIVVGIIALRNRKK